MKNNLDRRAFRRKYKVRYTVIAMQEHHAYILFADSIAVSELPTEYQTPSTDVFHTTEDVFSIGSARELTVLSVQKPFQSDTRVFVIEAKSIAHEAQNALLKLFEEPPAHAQFFLIVPATIFLLPTLRSRLMELEPKNGEKVEQTKTLTLFLELTYGQRIALVTQKTKDKDAVWVETLLSEAERTYGQEPLRNKDVLQKIIFIRTYSSVRGSSLKMLLEELALSLPKK